MALTWGTATASDIDEFYAGRPRESMRALAIRMDGQVVGVIGIAKEPDRDRAFSEYKPALEPHLKRMPVLRAIKYFVGWLEASKVPVYAISEGTGLLERLGFEPLSGNLFIWPQRSGDQ